jgi:hypothetical protein
MPGKPFTIVIPVMPMKLITALTQITPAMQGKSTSLQ